MFIIEEVNSFGEEIVIIEKQRLPKYIKLTAGGHEFIIKTQFAWLCSSTIRKMLSGSLSNINLYIYLSV